MDRLPLVALAPALLLALVGCSAESGPEEGARGGSRARVNSVAASAPKAAPESWCDSSHATLEGPVLVLPALAGPEAESLPAQQAGRWIWLNLWATWCSPCLREMDLLARWKDRLGRDGVKLDFWYLSLDDDPAAVAGFMAAHPGVPDGRRLRVARPDDVPAWFRDYGLDAESAIPVHLLVAPGGRVRCVRVGGVSEADYGLVRGLLAPP